MIKLRKASERGKTEIDWLHSHHSFSFGDYHDPANMGYRSLRVINDDIVEPGQGFGTHGHRDMEIISLVLEGALEHRDSLGHGEVLRPGEVQVMTAGRGIRHSEFNPSPSERAHFLQIWIQPEKAGLEPAYAQKPFPPAERMNTLRRVAGRDRVEADGALKINQDADLYLASLSPGKTVKTSLRSERNAWVHVATGNAVVAGQRVSAGDSLAINDVSEILLEGGTEPTELLFFDLA